VSDDDLVTSDACSYVAWGHSMLVDPWAEVQASAQEAETIVYSHIDMEAVAAVRKAIPTSAQRRLDVYKIESLRQ